MRSISLVLALALTLVAFACVRVQSGFTLGPENNGTTKTVSVGSELRLALPAELEWNIESTNTSALALKSSLLGSVGGTSMKMWLFDVKSAGEFVLRATGEPGCRKSVPPCLAPAVSYRFTIRAQ
jgi:hypothetical protein